MRAQEDRSQADRAGTTRPAPVMHIRQGTHAARLLALQRTAGNAAVTRTVEAERQEHDAACGHVPQVQRRALVHDVVNSPGQSMDPALKSEMEARFGGADFSGVRVHTGPLARESAKELGAKAYTTGPNIVIGDTMTKKDWAHELTHYEDQLRGPVPGTDNGAGVSVSSEGDSGERHAVQKAGRVMAGPVPDVQRVTEGEDDRPSHGLGHPGPVQRLALRAAPAEPVVQRAPATAAPTAVPGEQAQGEQVKITHPQIKLLTPRPNRLYRGDSRSPEEIKRAGGFLSQGTAYDKMIKHLLGRIEDSDNSGWISTSSSEEIAKDFATPPSRAVKTPGQPASLLPPKRAVPPSMTSEGWVYEIEASGNTIAFDDQAQGEIEKRQTEYTKEWGAIRKVNWVNIVRAVKWKSGYEANRYGFGGRAWIEPMETFENPDFQRGNHGYNPYTDPDSGWSDDKNVVDRTNTKRTVH